MDLADFTPPQNIEAERSVLGSILLDPEAIFKVADWLRIDDFYEKRHRLIYQAILTLFERRQPVDILTLTNQLEDQKNLEEIGGAAYLSSLINNVPTAFHIVDYAKIISSKAILRRLISAAGEIASLAYKTELSSEEIIDKAEQVLFAVAKNLNKQNFTSITEILNKAFERIDEVHKDKGKLRGLPTGFNDLDNLLAGLQKSDLIILAARPSMGKTSLALNIALNVAINQKVPVGIFSLEMSKEQLVDRLLCGEASVDSWKLRTGNLGEDDFPRLGEAIARLSEAPIFIDDSPIANVFDIRTKARRLQAENGLGLIIIDYLQLMEGGKNHDGRVQEISEISRALKALARELDVPVIAISQLSRAVEQRPSKIPQLSDLRESGSIEQDADVVAFIYREDYYEEDSEKKNIADILIKKHRNGPTGHIELYFEASQMKFYNLDKKHNILNDEIIL